MADEIYALSASTAAALKRLIGQRNAPTAKPAPKATGRRAVLVECIDASPAAGNHTLAGQCYGGLLLDPQAASNGTPDATAAVWLTVLGADAEPVAPVANQPYLGLMAGELTIGNVSRPRVFATEDNAGNGTAGLTAPVENLLINGNFRTNQYAENDNLATASLPSGNYAMDRWFAFCESGNTTGQRSRIGGTTLTEPTTYVGQFRPNANGGFVVGQIVEEEGTCAVRGQSLSFTSGVRHDGAGNLTVEAAVFYQATNADGASARTGFVSSWSGNAPVFSGNWTMLGNTTATAPASPAALANVSIDFTVPANATNLVCALWVANMPANRRLQIGRAAVYPDGVTEYREPDESLERLRCMRYFYAPRFNAYVHNLVMATAGFFANSFRWPFQFPTKMRKPPTFYNGGATDFGNVSDVNSLKFYQHDGKIANGSVSSFGYLMTAANGTNAQMQLSVITPGNLATPPVGHLWCNAFYTVSFDAEI